LHREWGGRASSLLGLTGSPEFEQFRWLLHGLDPRTGKQLTARLDDDRLAGWDVMACVPKGVTLVIERGDDRVRDLVWQADRWAMADLERYATTRVRKGGVHDERVTGNLAWYSVEYPETRPVEDETLPKDHPWREMPDPDWHNHNVIVNHTWDRVELRGPTRG
jgi:conjugative relaxase-like TrwC/TraI family protein